MKVMSRFILILMLLLHLDSHGVQFEKLGTAIARTLGTKKAYKTSVDVGGEKTTVYYAKDGSGSASKYAVIQKGIYEPNCTHTWVIGVTPGSATVEQVRVVEMSCPHAFPTNKASFLDQYKGKSLKDVKGLKGKVHTIAKATGSSDLTTKAVQKAVLAVSKLR